MRLIDADKLYKYLDNKYPCDKYVELEDIFEIIEKCQTVNAIKVSPNLTNKGFVKKAFPDIEIVDEEHKGIIYGYEKSDSIKSIVPLMGFKTKWLKEKYIKEDK